MRPAPALLQLAVCLSSLSSFASGSPWPGWLPDKAALVAVRADATTTPGPTGTGESASQTDNSSASQTDSGQGKDLNTAEPTQSGDTASETGTGSATGKKTGKGTGKATGTKTGKTHSTFAPDSPPGGVSMLTPAPNLQATPLYKIGDDVTWSWNYTSLQGTPTAVDVLVSCSVASNTWTLTSNMTFATSVNYVWETKEEAGSVQNPLLTEMYTLIVKDSDTQITSAPEPGYLGTWQQFRFGLYAPQPYVPYSEWKCPGQCSSGSSLFDRQAIGLAVSMSVVTFLSFTWFVAGLGLH
ncbi:hypothetical protein VFPFJ_06241 [Purpureocillium lilacinum]|nr:hypothetical protein VFPFJ_06241 [Purpureocillium lilacinum]OAQ67358.1 hypothetical protein VFPBJ_10953 [Purpureocillium lilacinum]OAQ89827.1 hypothetical protein VFPFJ_06241 [Purpureocillium lilacinum]GJN69517.1 hypothetical protein PLICBS_003566 [Purpureocillium lilacinum]GJN76804.1 hypothetical protein PLIIFM63780_000291 [Purpureocillium lilacinum]